MVRVLLGGTLVRQERRRAGEDAEGDERPAHQAEPVPEHPDRLGDWPFHESARGSARGVAASSEKILRMPTSIYAMLGVAGIFWGILTWVENDGSVPLAVSIGLIVGGVLMFVVWHRAWQRRG